MPPALTTTRNVSGCADGARREHEVVPEVAGEAEVLVVRTGTAVLTTGADEEELVDGGRVLAGLPPSVAVTVIEMFVLSFGVCVAAASAWR